jgi:hypothetical protein
MSHNLHEAAERRVESYRGNGHFQHLLYLYLAGKMLHVPTFPVVEEDVRDGSLAAHHQVLLIAGVDYLDQPVLTALETFRSAGGAILVSDDSKVKIPGAKVFHFPNDGLRLNAAMDQWADNKQWDQWSASIYSNNYFKKAQPVAEALKPALAALGVRPIFDCDQPGVAGSRQSFGDVEYLFAVNASPDDETFGWYYLRPVTAAIGFPDDGRQLYDALQGGVAQEFRKQGNQLTAHLRMGPGQMRAFARTARPIGGIQVMTPLVSKDLTTERTPLQVEISALLVDDQKQVLCGSVPLRLEVFDPLQSKRFDLYRATDRGVLRVSLSLAANDPPGPWRVIVTDLLANTRGEAAFTLPSLGSCAAVAGQTRGALCFGPDRVNIFRFFRTHKDLTLIPGSSRYDAEQAKRLARILEPWDIRCKTVPAASVKRRGLTAQEKPTWVDAAGAFDVRGPVILLGNPDDNPLIRHLQDQKFLPYSPVREQMPGPGSGFIAWQREGLAYFGHESVTLIAYDEAGLAEAVGIVYQIAAGMEPLLPRDLPQQATIQPANVKPQQPPRLALAWHTKWPDRIIALRAVPDGIIGLSEDGTLRKVSRQGKTVWEKTVEAGEFLTLDASADGKVIALGAGHRLRLWDEAGNLLQDVPLALPRSPLPQKPEGISFVVLGPDRGHMLVGWGQYFQADSAWQYSSVLIWMTTKGEIVWTIGGPAPKTGKPIFPERLRFGAYASDGKKLLVLSDKKAQIIDISTGKFNPAIERLNYPLAWPLGENWLLSDGDSKIMTVDPATGAIVSELQCPGTGPAVLVPTEGGFLLGTEADGMLCKVREAKGKLADQTAWQVRSDTKMVKQLKVSADRIVVAYWGGTVRILDQGGGVLAEEILSQDVVDLIPTGDQMVAALADGNVQAFATKTVPQ